MRLRFVAALVVVVAVVASWITAQAQWARPVPPKVMVGDDLGFRVEGLRGDVPVGSIVIKVNGEWVKAELASGLFPPPRP